MTFEYKKHLFHICSLFKTRQNQIIKGGLFKEINTEQVNVSGKGEPGRLRLRLRGDIA